MVGAALTLIAVCAVPLALAGVLGAIAFRIATGCRHKWGVEREVAVYDVDLPSDAHPVARKYHLRCANCGAMRMRRF